MTGQLDLYYWDRDNITELCTRDCTQSASDWLQGVNDVCDGQTITIDSKIVPVESVADRYADGIGLACLTDNQLPILLSFNQTPEVDPTPTDSPFPITTGPSNPNPSGGNDVPFRDRYSTFNYCFLEAQNWVGVDIVPADCGADPTNILCTDPEAGNRIVGSCLLLGKPLNKF
ncbi:MAG: hypothetical protein Q9201_001149 [Fulgogasparrea decipioides]